MVSVLDLFHPAVAAWFTRAFAAPTAAQTAAWPAITNGRHTLIAAPTGSGKTLAAFLAVIDPLAREAAAGHLADETRVLYVSPLKALSNDIHRNLDAPLAGIRDEFAARRLAPLNLRSAVRTGDTSQAERARMRRHPPHIVVTTPESLYVLLGSASGRSMLGTCRTVIIDEIHAIAGNKRGTHLALSLQRLQAICTERLVRIGLSATQEPIEEVAHYLTGRSPADGGCAIVDSGHRRSRDLALELPPVPLGPVMAGEVWALVYERMAALVRAHRTTLIFVNTRRLAERVTRHLSELLGAEHVATHHGSLSKERRLKAEQQLKRGELKALVATASLELGIDIGEIDLVCQIGSTRSINAFLQRVGRAGHAVGGTSKGRLFPLSRDELVECAALLDAVRRGELDRLVIPCNALDVLTQQIAAEVAGQEWHEDALYSLMCGAYPYASLPREDFDACVAMLAQGFSTRRGRHGALIHHDAVNRLLRPRKGARLTSITSGGAIPDNADYKVMLEPDGFSVGSVNEDFAVESLQGDIFQLGNTSYRILRVERGTVRVEDAHGQPPSIPFWLGEAPGRTHELSMALSRLRSEVSTRLDAAEDAAPRWLEDELGLDRAAAAQLTDYLRAGRAALQVLPTRETLVFERFFDESGGMQLVIHSPFGSRMNRAWGLALRKRFCRTFNFELQAAATEDHIVLSLTQAHSFVLSDVAKYLHSNSARHVLVQALCAAPMFGVRWRWVAGIALALPRFRGGKKMAPQIIRMNAEDLLTALFPDQTACAENLSGEISVPEHPLVRQTVRDCLEEAMDIDLFENVLRGIECGRIRIIARDLTEPSPLALEALNARPYAYLDDAPLEERRTHAVMARRWIDPASAADIGRLDPEAIRRVREEAWPDGGNAEELCDGIYWLTYLTDQEVRRSDGWSNWIGELVAQGRILRIAGDARPTLWVAVERRALFESAWPPPDAALVEIVRGRLEGLGPTTAAAMGASLGLDAAAIRTALGALEVEGFAMRMRTATAIDEEAEWCERRLLARIHRYTVKRLRAEIEPVSAREFLRFLCEWQRVLPAARMQGEDAVAATLAQLEGYEAPAAAWEAEILPARIADYDPAWLDAHCRAGRYVWLRVAAGQSKSPRAGPLLSTPIALLGRRHTRIWTARGGAFDAASLRSRPRAIFDFLGEYGASFFDDLAEAAGMLPVEAEQALGELVALGLVNSDGFAGLRALLIPASRRRKPGARLHRGRMAMAAMADSGRWALVKQGETAPSRGPDDSIEHVVRTLLRRWGVIFWKLIAREADWLPSFRDIVTCCRRLEARGDLRGGRFVAGFAGEQFATADAVSLLREVRRRPESGDLVCVSGADPLNLLGILTPGARLPALRGNRLVYRDGLPLASFAAGEITYLTALDAGGQRDVQQALRSVERRRRPAAAQRLDQADARLQTAR